MSMTKNKPYTILVEDCPHGMVGVSLRPVYE